MGPPSPDRPLLLPGESHLTAPEARGFSGIDTWVFDLDNTLYPRDCNLFAQIDVKMKAFIGQLLDVDVEEAHRIQKQYFRSHGTTLRGLMDNHGLAPEEFLDYVHDIDVSPVPPNPALDDVLHRIEGRKVIYRIALAVFKIMEKRLVEGDMQDMFEIIKDFKSQDVDTQALLKVANNFTFAKELMTKYENEFTDEKIKKPDWAEPFKPVTGK